MPEILTIDDSHIAVLAPALATGWSQIDDALARLIDEVDRSAIRVLLVVPGDVSHLDPPPEGLYFLERLRLPTVTWLTGDTTDHALAIALACDIRVGGPGNLQFASRIAAARSTRRLHALLFDDAYTESLLAGEPSSTELAYRAGLVSSFGAGPEAEARRIAAVLAERAPIATSLAKEAIWRGLPLPLEQALRTETDLTMLLISTKDRAEGVAAFVGKRPPRFIGE